MTPWTTRRRMQCMYDHREADRIPLADIPWPATLERWRREGMPAEVDFAEFFDLDRFASIHVDTSPRFEARILEETPECQTRTTRWGVTLKNWTHAASTPEFLDFTVKDRAGWERAKARMSPAPDRIEWRVLRRDFPRWRAEGRWIRAGLWFGFDVTHSWFVGTERLLIALVEDPDWCRDLFAHELETNLSLLDQVWNAGYHFDAVAWPDDMGYKGTQFFSRDLYREVLKPFHRRAIEWAHARGIRAELHSCGNINPFIPELLELGLDALNPLEVKAGMDPLDLKRRYGDRLLLHGGVNAVLWERPGALHEEMRRVIPDLKRNGGYLFSSDHSVPSSVSLETFRETFELARRLGAY